MATPQNPLASFLWGEGGAALTPEDIAKRKALLAAQGGKTDTSPISHWTQGAARLVDALGTVLEERRLGRAEKDSSDYNSGIIQSLLGSSTPSAESAATPPSASAIPMTAAASDIKAGLAQDPVQGAMDAANPPAASTGNSPWLAYDNANATRNKPLNEKLVSALGFLPDLGVTAQVFSGGQDAEGPNRTGSHRHDNGGAGDMRFFKDGRMLDWANEADRPIFEQIVTRGRENGLTGFGAGDGYMQQGTMHVGFGSPGVWGAGGRGSNAPSWLQAAFDAGGRAPTQTQMASAAPMVASDAMQGAIPTPMQRPDPMQMQQVPDPSITAQASPQLAAPVNVSAPPPVASVPQQAPVAPQQQLAQALTAQPQAPQQAPNNQALIKALTDPRASDATKRIASALLQAQQARQQAAAQAEQEQQTWLQRQQIQQQMQQADPQNQATLRKTNLEISGLEHPADPDSVRALDARAQRAGLQPGTKEYSDFFISQGVRTPAQVGTPPAGYQIKYDDAGNPVSMAPIPGGPADTSKKDQLTADNKLTSTDVITNAAQRAREAMAAQGLFPATGIMGNVAAISPESNASELRRQVSVLKSNATIENLNAMRQQSPTGGALGNVTEGEGAMLSAKAGTLDPNSPNFSRDLNDYEKTLLRIVHGKDAGDKMFDQTRVKTPDEQKPVDDKPPASMDKPELWKYMTPEEKKLWQ